MNLHVCFVCCVTCVLAGVGPIGVKPKIRVLKSGRLALSTGRPGIYLYIAADPPTSWQRFNIAAAHNIFITQKNLTFACPAPPPYQCVPGGGLNGTTSYTGMVVAKDGPADADAVYVSYDRLGNGWGTVSKGQASAVFVMKLEISDTDSPY